MTQITQLQRLILLRQKFCRYPGSVISDSSPTSAYYPSDCTVVFAYVRSNICCARRSNHWAMSTITNGQDLLRLIIETMQLKSLRSATCSKTSSNIYIIFLEISNHIRNLLGLFLINHFEVYKYTWLLLSMELHLFISSLSIQNMVRLSDYWNLPS